MNQHKQYDGIPESLTLEQVKSWVKPRISEKRFKHVEGVVEVARRLAPVAGCDTFLAELSAWLHDSCKDEKSRALISTAEEAGLSLHPVERIHGKLLHGPVAAVTSEKELGVTNKEVLDAISQHTLGAVPMSPLAKVLYLADCLEPGRPKSYADPIWNALDLGGANNMDAAIVAASNIAIQSQISSGLPIHPTTVAVRNYYLSSPGTDAGE